MLDNLFNAMIHDIFFVIPVVAGSSPVVHPIIINKLGHFVPPFLPYW